jgi:hypothetical protein
MATSPTIPGAAGGAVTGQKNMGIPVLGNNGGLNQHSPLTGVGTGGVSTIPGATAVSTGIPPNTNKLPYMQPPGQQVQALNQPVVLGATPTSTATTAAPVNNGNPIAQNPQQQQLLNKQLIDIYGKGTGGALANLIGNLGSNDSSYLQAYQNAMAKTKAEGLSTIGTSLGNAGISANSSVSAIEKADYSSGLDAQTGLQEQQLIQNQQQLQASLLQGTQDDAKAEVGTSWLDTFGQVAGIAGNIAGDVIGMGGGGGIKSAIQALNPFKAAPPPMLQTGGVSQLPGSFGAPTTPQGISYQPNLPGLDF